MASILDIRRRIRGISNMEKITKAMKMVAAARLRKCQERVVAARPYTRQMHEILARLAQNKEEATHPLLEKRTVQTVGYVVITSDRGLCGGYNANIIRMTKNMLAKEEHEAKLVVVGRKGRDSFRHGKVEMLSEFVGIGDFPSYSLAKEIAQQVINAYTEGIFDEVYLVYNEFISAINQQPKQIKILPVEQPEGQSGKDYIFEPSSEEILNTLLPKYVETAVFRTLLEGKASEMGSKMTAMGAASDNAKDLIDSLTLQMNRARQAAITKEITEIVGGAAALE